MNNINVEGHTIEAWKDAGYGFHEANCTVCNAHLACHNRTKKLLQFVGKKWDSLLECGQKAPEKVAVIKPIKKSNLDLPVEMVKDFAVEPAAVVSDAPVKRGRGRPKGSKNKR